MKMTYAIVVYINIDTQLFCVLVYYTNLTYNYVYMSVSLTGFELP